MGLGANRVRTRLLIAVPPVDVLPIAVAEFHILSFNERSGILIGRVEGTLNHTAGNDILILGTNKSSALTRLYMLKFDNLNHLAVQLKGDTVSKIAS